jgi:hypothetical protein
MFQMRQSWSFPKGQVQKGRALSSMQSLPQLQEESASFPDSRQGTCAKCSLESIQSRTSQTISQELARSSSRKTPDQWSKLVQSQYQLSKSEETRKERLDYRSIRHSLDKANRQMCSLRVSYVSRRKLRELCSCGSQSQNFNATCAFVQYVQQATWTLRIRQTSRNARFSSSSLRGIPQPFQGRA